MKGGDVFGTYLVFRSHEMVTGRNFEFFVIFRQTVAGAVLDRLRIMRCFVSCNSMKSLNVVERQYTKKFLKWLNGILDFCFGG